VLTSIVVDLVTVLGVVGIVIVSILAILVAQGIFATLTLDPSCVKVDTTLGTISEQISTFDPA
jgi:beta-lactamase regulating signal transducer with metallopeptidase domain